jgi:hypothetical protein
MDTVVTNVCGHHATLPHEHPTRQLASSRHVGPLIDDLRSFSDGRSALVARTSGEGVPLLQQHRQTRIDELRLDHELGGEDTIWPVAEVLERAAFDGGPYDIGQITDTPAWRRGSGWVITARRTEG